MEAQPSTMSVYDRLYDTRSYTGTHSSRAANHGGGSGGTRKPRSRSFVGNTNANTDEVIRDISQITRPNLNRTPTRNRMKKSARSKADISMEAAIAGGLPSTLDTNAQLKLIFRYYCRFGRTTGDNDMLHNANWAKFCRECPELLDGRAITNAEIDLTFTKSKGKKERRLSYGRFLDALSALASKKFPDADAATGFSMLLARHVFRCPAAVAGGDTAPTHRTHPSDRRPSRARRSSSGKRAPPQAPSPSTGRYGGGGGGGHGHRPVPAPGAAVSAGRQSWRQTPPAQPPTSSFMLYNQEPTMFMEEVGPGNNAGGSAPNAGPPAGPADRAGAPPPLVHAGAAPDHDPRDYGGQDAGAGSGDYQYTSYAAAVATARAAAAAHAATRARDISNLHAGSASSGTPAAVDAAGAAPDAGPAPASRPDATTGAASSGAVAPMATAPASATPVAAPPGGSAFLPPTQPAPTAVAASAPLSPAAIAATAAAAAAQAAANSQGDAGAAAAASALYHATYAAHAAQLAMQQAAAQARAHGIELPPALMAPLTGPGGQVFSSPYRAPVAGGELAMPAGMVYQQAPAQHHGHRTPTKGRKGRPPTTPGSTPRRRKSERPTPRSGGRRGSAGSYKQLSSAPSSASNTAVPLGTTPSRHAMVTSASFRPRKSTLPGEGIKPGSVYDRLTNPGSFTGVYRRAWETDGRMNAHADIASAKSFRGNTNTNSNANIHDISMTLRPSLSMSPARRKAFR